MLSLSLRHCTGFRSTPSSKRSLLPHSQFIFDALRPKVDRALVPNGVLAVWTYCTPKLSHPKANEIFQEFFEWLHTEGEYISLTSTPLII